jgi:hypothetical protein
MRKLSRKMQNLQMIKKMEHLRMFGKAKFLLIALIMAITGFSVSAQNYTDPVAAKNAIAAAPLNGVVRIDNIDWYVVKKQNSTSAMLVTVHPIQALANVQFSLITVHNNVYEGSNLQGKLTTYFNAYATSLLNVIRQIAVMPTIGNVSDNKSLTFLTLPKSPITPAGSQRKDVLFALTYRDVVDWNGPSNFVFSSSYYHRWWTRTGNSAIPSYAYEVNIPGGVVNGTADVSSSLEVAVGVWVACGASQYSISGKLTGGDVANKPVTYKIGTGANQSVQTDVNGNYIIPNIDGGSVVLITPPYQAEYTVDPTTITTPPLTSNLTNQNFNYYKLTVSGCANEGVLLYKEDFGGNNQSDPSTSPVGLPPGSSDFNYGAGTGFYTITKNPHYIYPSEFHSTSDHTYPNDDTRGYMMFIDPDLGDIGKIFYQTEMNDLCDVASVSFSAWFMSINSLVSGVALPKIELQLVDKYTNAVYYTTGDQTIPYGNTWTQRGFDFELPPGVNNVKLRILNKENLTRGNDLAIDDIEIRLCVPPVIIPTDTLTACEGVPFDLVGYYNDDGSFGNNLVYRWEYSVTGNINHPNEWTPILGSEGTTTTGIVVSSYTIPSVALSNAGYYRLVVGKTSAMSWNCRSSSKLVYLIVTGASTASQINVSGATICANNTATLIASSTGITAPEYKWYGSLTGNDLLFTGAAFTTPLLSETTTYYVSVSGEGVCEGANNATGRKPVTVTVYAPSTGDITTPDPLCVNGTTTMSSSVGGGTWRSLNPDIVQVTNAATGAIKGLNAGTATIVYTVTDGDCINADAVEVTVLPTSNSSLITIEKTSPVCANDLVEITVWADDVIDPIFKWYISANETTPFFTGNYYTTSDLTEDTIYYITVSGKNYCAEK